MTSDCIAPPTVGPAALPRHHRGSSLFWWCIKSNQTVSPINSPACNLHSFLLKLWSSLMKLWPRGSFSMLFSWGRLISQVRLAITIILTSSRLSMNVLVPLNSKMLEEEFQQIKPLISPIKRWENAVQSHMRRHTHPTQHFPPGGGDIAPAGGGEKAVSRQRRSQSHPRPLITARVWEGKQLSQAPINTRISKWRRH